MSCWNWMVEIDVLSGAGAKKQKIGNRRRFSPSGAAAPRCHRNRRSWFQLCARERTSPIVSPLLFLFPTVGKKKKKLSR